MQNSFALFVRVSSLVRMYFFNDIVALFCCLFPLLFFELFLSILICLSIFCYAIQFFLPTSELAFFFKKNVNCVISSFSLFVYFVFYSPTLLFLLFVGIPFLSLLVLILFVLLTPIIYIIGQEQSVDGLTYVYFVSSENILFFISIFIVHKII